MKENLREPAQQAVDEVRESGRRRRLDGARRGADRSPGVTDTAKESAENLRDGGDRASDPTCADSAPARRVQGRSRTGFRPWTHCRRDE